jgi:trypsin
MFKLIVLTAALAVCYGSPTFGQLPKPRLDGSAGSRVVGGVETTVEHAPHQVSLQNNGRHTCGGSLVDKKWVLTAAHCTDGSSANALRVRVGSSQHAEGGQLVNVKRVVQHEKFNYNTIDFDFSLLELAEELEFDTVKQKVKLPEQDEPVKDGTLCEVTGWGVTQNPQESTEVLRVAYVPAVNQKECASSYSLFGGVTDRMLCAGYKEGGKDACQGDSGGKLETFEGKFSLLGFFKKIIRFQDLFWPMANWLVSCHGDMDALNPIIQVFIPESPPFETGSRNTPMSEILMQMVFILNKYILRKAANIILSISAAPKIEVITFEN